MDRHSGCFVCSGGAGEILRSMPDMATHTSIALCRRCWELPTAALRRKIDSIRAAMKAAREAAAEA
jgi:hypothetical protein